MKRHVQHLRTRRCDRTDIRIRRCLNANMPHCSTCSLSPASGYPYAPILRTLSIGQEWHANAGKDYKTNLSNDT